MPRTSASALTPPQSPSSTAGRCRPHLHSRRFAAAIAAWILGGFAVRLGGVYLAMLTLAFAQIVWSIAFQWDAVTGGSNGLVGIWPPALLADRAHYYLFTLVIVAVGDARAGAHRAFAVRLRVAWRARLGDARGRRRHRRPRRRNGARSCSPGAFAGLAGGLYAFSKGSISPETLAIPRSVDALVMVLLGGLNAIAGPLIGAATFTWMQDALARSTDYWRAATGALILAIVLRVPARHRRGACADASRARREAARAR